MSLIQSGRLKTTSTSLEYEILYVLIANLWHDISVQIYNPISYTPNMPPSKFNLELLTAAYFRARFEIENSNKQMQH
jgi:hypothetical protein